MNPEERQKMKELENKVKELEAYISERKKQQISFPLDVASKTALGSPYGEGVGTSTLTQSVNVPATPTAISVPAAYAQTFILIVNGVRYEVPSLI